MTSKEEIEEAINTLVKSTESGYAWTKNSMDLLEKLTEWKKDNKDKPLNISIHGDLMLKMLGVVFDYMYYYCKMPADHMIANEELMQLYKELRDMKE